MVWFFSGCREYKPSDGGSGEGRFRLQAFRQHQQMKENSSFSDKKWNMFGPRWMSGRITDVAVPEGSDSTVYAASASGGVWKSYDQGKSWEPVFEDAASTSIGDLAVAPSDTHVVWIGTGEANIFRSSMAGVGIYKSVDAGKTWKHMGLSGTYTIGRILVHPEDPDIVYVAASGHEWSHNEARGVFKTTNGGKTWDKVFYINEKIGAIDLVMDPENPNTLYASMWNRIRKRWSDPVPKPGDGIFKTNDAGDTWRKLSKGLPNDSLTGRIGIDVAQSDPDVLYAFVDNHHVDTAAEAGTDAYGREKSRQVIGAEIYRSADKGESWMKVSPDTGVIGNLTRTYGWVFGQIRVDPTDKNTIYVMGVPLAKSTDGGKTFTELSDEGLHVDHHALWIDPDNPDLLINGNDGGINVSHDQGKTWYNNKTLPVVQFYNANYDLKDPFRVYGSVQDNGSFRGPIDQRPGVDSAGEWVEIPGGEATYIAMDRKESDMLFTSSYYGRLRKSRYVDGEWKTEKILTEAEEGEPELRGQWLAPTIMSQHDDSVLYHGFQFVFKTPDRGETWEKISPDLTNYDPQKQGELPYAINFATISSLSESPLQQGLLYAGTDDGNVHITRNDGDTWTNIIGELPKGKHVSRVCASRHNESTVYLTLNGKREDDFKAYIYRSDDYGNSWTDITSNIPIGPVNVIIEDPRYRNVLYAGTDIGVYISTNRGESWEVLGSGMPSTYVHDLRLHPRDLILVAATHGRSLYKMDVSNIQRQ
jgi:photosystem II stability/assembly factor-like uncharacterized protein